LQLTDQTGKLTDTNFNHTELITALTNVSKPNLNVIGCRYDQEQITDTSEFGSKKVQLQKNVK
jgi:hypothetical protein